MDDPQVPFVLHADYKLLLFAALVLMMVVLEVMAVGACVVLVVQVLNQKLLVLH